MMIQELIASIADMLSPAFLLISLALIVILKVIGKRPKRKIGGKFRALSHLNTKAEQNFFKQLSGKLPSHFYIAPKVRLADICKPDDPKNIVGFNKIARKHVDFVVVERESSKVMCVIELDDRSHQKKDSIRRDKEKNYALSSAGIVLHRVKAARNYNQAIEKIIDDLGSCKGYGFNEYHSKVCERCKSGDTERIKMSWPNKGKAYIRCQRCNWQTEPFKI